MWTSEESNAKLMWSTPQSYNLKYKLELRTSWYQLPQKFDKSSRFHCIYNLQQDPNAKLYNQSQKSAPKLTNHVTMRNSLPKCKWVKPDGYPTPLDMQEFLTIYFIFWILWQNLVSKCKLSNQSGVPRYANVAGGSQGILH